MVSKTLADHFTEDELEEHFVWRLNKRELGAAMKILVSIKNLEKERMVLSATLEKKGKTLRGQVGYKDVRLKQAHASLKEDIEGIDAKIFAEYEKLKELSTYAQSVLKLDSRTKTVNSIAHNLRP